MSCTARKFSELPATFLTWCDNCKLAREEVGTVRECPECGESICFQCYLDIHRIADEDDLVLIRPADKIFF